MSRRPSPEISDRDLAMRLARAARRIDDVLGPPDPQLFRLPLEPRMYLVRNTVEGLPSPRWRPSQRLYRYCAAGAAGLSACMSIGLAQTSVAASPAPSTARSSTARSSNVTTVEMATGMTFATPPLTIASLTIAPLTIAPVTTEDQTTVGSTTEPVLQRS